VEREHTGKRQRGNFTSGRIANFDPVSIGSCVESFVVDYMPSVAKRPIPGRLQIGELAAVPIFKAHGAAADVEKELRHLPIYPDGEAPSLLFGVSKLGHALTEIRLRL